MNDHSKYAEGLALYVAGTLDQDRRRAIERHLAQCAECRSEVALWQQVAGQIVAANHELMAPPGSVERALAQVHPRRANIFRRAAELVSAQVLLVRSDLWLACAAIMAMGVIVATVVNDIAVLRMLAPMVAAASIAVIYGPENDPAIELTVATATSPWKILLARLTLVFGYNLVLGLVASGGMLLLVPAETVVRLILDWLCPMTLLSAAALLLALEMGTGNAILVTYLVWLVRFLPAPGIAQTFRLDNTSLLMNLLDYYRRFWTNPPLLLVLAAILVVGAVWLTSRTERHLPRWA